MRVAYLFLREASGYAVAAERCLRALGAVGVDVVPEPFVPGGAVGLGYEPLDPGPPTSCDVVVAHLVPEYWPYVRARYPGIPLVGHTVWETDRLPAHWPRLLEVADRIVVPIEDNAELMRREGVRRPIDVVPHVAPEDAISSSTAWDWIDPTTFVCYTIGPWTTRKAMPDVVRAYQRAFAGRRDTLLIVKTSLRDFTQPDLPSSGPAGRGTTAWSLARLLGETGGSAADVRLVAGEVDAEDVDALHVRGDCCISLSHAEGWSIPVFDAAARGTPVVVTAHGGPLAYLTPDSAFLVDCELVPVDDPWNTSYTPDQRWAQPSVQHAAELLREIEADRAAAAARVASARERIAAEFAPDVVGAACRAVLDQLVH